jgi:hypothetical protein
MGLEGGTSEGEQGKSSNGGIQELIPSGSRTTAAGSCARLFTPVPGAGLELPPTSCGPIHAVASVQDIRLMGERSRASLLLRPGQSASVGDRAVISDHGWCLRVGLDDRRRCTRPVTDAQPTEDDEGGSILDLDVEEVGDGPDGPYLSLKDGTVITYEVPEDRPQTGSEGAPSSRCPGSPTPRRRSPAQSTLDDRAALAYT